MNTKPAIAGLKRPKTCLGCMAYEEGMGFQSTGYCQLGHPVRRIELVAGFYGYAKQLIGCRAAPEEPCEKPMSNRQFIKLWMKKNE